VSARWRALIWVQSLLGSGHLRRALLLADALARSGAEVVLANGGLPGRWSAPAGVRIVQLPVITARSADFADLVDGRGAPVGDGVRAERGRILAGLLGEPPQVVITEMFP
jgi:predicted glycosyltransferase